MRIARQGVRLALPLITLLAMTACGGPVPTETLRTSADRHVDRGEYEKAAEEYGQIVERYPGDWRAQASLGRCELELGPLDREASESLIDGLIGDADIPPAVRQAVEERTDWPPSE